MVSYLECHKSINSIYYVWNTNENTRTSVSVKVEMIRKTTMHEKKLRNESLMTPEHEKYISCSVPYKRTYIMNTTMQHVPVFVYGEHSQVISNMQSL